MTVLIKRRNRLKYEQRDKDIVGGEAFMNYVLISRAGIIILPQPDWFCAQRY